MTELFLAGLLSISNFTGQIELTPPHEELQLTGEQIEALQPLLGQRQMYLEVDQKYFSLKKLGAPQKGQTYKVQFSAEEGLPTNYNDRFLPYYDFARKEEYLNRTQTLWEANDYQLETIGQSLEGRTIEVIYPKNFSANKQTIVMLGRQHGDEGTQNWIIEGFLNSFLQQDNKNWQDHFQIIVYPMINPDGTENHIRYNKNQRDLNRWWKPSGQYEQEAHEVALVHRHLDGLLKKSQAPVAILLDMHGSFTEDFLYRVGRNYISPEYYDLQTPFVDGLGIYDPWQKNNAQISNGDPGMVRIMMGQHYGYNALTHETPRDIAKASERTVDDLMSQGRAIYQTVWDVFH